MAFIDTTAGRARQRALVTPASGQLTEGAEPEERGEGDDVVVVVPHHPRAVEEQAVGEEAADEEHGVVHDVHGRGVERVEVRGRPAREAVLDEHPVGHDRVGDARERAEGEEREDKGHHDHRVRPVVHHVCAEVVDAEASEDHEDAWRGRQRASLWQKARESAYVP
jgi:hypothetical protein